MSIIDYVQTFPVYFKYFSECISVISNTVGLQLHYVCLEGLSIVLLLRFYLIKSNFISGFRQLILIYLIRKSMIGRLKILNDFITNHRAQIEKLQSILHQQATMYKEQGKEGQHPSNIDTKDQQNNHYEIILQAGQCLNFPQQKRQYQETTQKTSKIEELPEQAETSMIIQKVRHKNIKGKYLLTLNPKLIEKYSSRQVKNDSQRIKIKNRKVQLQKSHGALQIKIQSVRRQIQNIKKEIEQNREQFLGEYDFVINLLGTNNLTERKDQKSEFYQINEETINTEILQTYPKRAKVQEIIMEESDQDDRTCQEQASWVQNDDQEIESIWHHNKRGFQAVEKLQKKRQVSEKEGQQIWNNFLKKLTYTHIRKIECNPNLSNKQACTQQFKQNHLNSKKYSQKLLNHGLKQLKNPGNHQNILNNTKNSKGCIVQDKQFKDFTERQNNKLQIEISQLNLNQDFFNSLVGRLNSLSGNGSSANTEFQNSIRQSYNTSLAEKNKQDQLQKNAEFTISFERMQSKNSHHQKLKSYKTHSCQSVRLEIASKFKQFKKALKIDRGIARFNLAIK